MHIQGYDFRDFIGVDPSYPFFQLLIEFHSGLDEEDVFCLSGNLSLPPVE